MKTIKIGSVYKFKSQHWNDLYDYKTCSYFNLKSDKLFTIISYDAKMSSFTCLANDKIYEISIDDLKDKLEPLI